MCDYSLQTVQSRPAKAGDKLTVKNFGTGTKGFAAQENPAMAVCVLPGTELAFNEEVAVPALGFLWREHKRTLGHKTAIFRQINKDMPHIHHDALEFATGKTVLLRRQKSYGVSVTTPMTRPTQSFGRRFWKKEPWPQSC